MTMPTDTPPVPDGMFDPKFYDEPRPATDSEREAAIQAELVSEHFWPDCHCDRCFLLRILGETRARQ
jgi:hypothetical protein